MATHTTNTPGGRDCSPAPAILTAAIRALSGYGPRIPSADLDATPIPQPAPDPNHAPPLARWQVEAAVELLIDLLDATEDTDADGEEEDCCPAGDDCGGKHSAFDAGLSYRIGDDDDAESDNGDEPDDDGEPEPEDSRTRWWHEAEFGCGHGPFQTAGAA